MLLTVDLLNREDSARRDIGRSAFLSSHMWSHLHVLFFGQSLIDWNNIRRQKDWHDEFCTFIEVFKENQRSRHPIVSPKANKRKKRLETIAGCGCKIGTQNFENFDEEEKSLASAWRTLFSLFLSFPFQQLFGFLIMIFLIIHVMLAAKITRLQSRLQSVHTLRRNS